jgi:hypothetical protein
VACHYATIFSIEDLSTPKSSNIYFALALSSSSALSNSSISPQTKIRSLTVIPPSLSTLLIEFIISCSVIVIGRLKIGANGLALGEGGDFHHKC